MSLTQQCPGRDLGTRHGSPCRSICSRPFQQVFGPVSTLRGMVPRSEGNNTPGSRMQGDASEGKKREDVVVRAPPPPRRTPDQKRRSRPPSRQPRNGFFSDADPNGM